MPSDRIDPPFDFIVMPVVWWWQRRTGGYRSTRWRERMIARRFDRGK